jgi:hypothetical protein
MLMLAIIMLLVGLLLGWRFKVHILIPIIGLAWAIIAVVDNGNGVGRLVGTMAFVAILLQLGYVGGVALRLVPYAPDHGDPSEATSTEAPLAQIGLERTSSPSIMPPTPVGWNEPTPGAAANDEARRLQ